MRFLLPSNAGMNVAEEPFHRRFTVVEGFGSKSALIKIHLSSIYMLASVTKHVCLLACLSPLTKSAVLQQPICLEKRLQMK